MRCGDDKRVVGWWLIDGWYGVESSRVYNVKMMLIRHAMSCLTVMSCHVWLSCLAYPHTFSPFLSFLGFLFLSFCPSLLFLQCSLLVTVRALVLVGATMLSILLPVLVPVLVLVLVLVLVFFYLTGMMVRLRLLLVRLLVLMLMMWLIILIIVSLRSLITTIVVAIAIAIAVVIDGCLLGVKRLGQVLQNVRGTESVQDLKKHTDGRKEQKYWKGVLVYRVYWWDVSSACANLPTYTPTLAARDRQSTPFSCPCPRPPPPPDPSDINNKPSLIWQMS